MTLRLSDPHHRWTCTLTSGRVCIRVRWNFLEGLLKSSSLRRQAGFPPSELPETTSCWKLGYTGIMGLPKGQRANQVKRFENLPRARNSEGIQISASLA